MTRVDRNLGWRDPVGTLEDLRESVRTLTRARHNFRVRMDKATFSLALRGPEDFPKRIRRRAAKVLGVRSKVRQDYVTDSLFHFERLKPSQRERLISDIINLYEACLMDLGKIDRERLYYPSDLPRPWRDARRYFWLGGSVTIVSAIQRLNKAEKILVTVSAELIRAISLQAMLARCANERDILNTLNHSREAFGFVTVRNAIHRDLTVTLLTVLERGQKRSACIPRLLEIASDPRVVELMKNSTARDDVEDRIDRAERGFAQLETDGMLKSLRKLRDKVIAHVEVPPVAHGAKYGDADRVLERTIPIFQDLSVVILDREYQLDGEQRFWRQNADSFWTHVAKPRTSAEPEFDEADTPPGST